MHNNDGLSLKLQAFVGNFNIIFSTDDLRKRARVFGLETHET